MKILQKEAAARENFKGLFDDIDVNSNKLGATVTRRNEKLVKLMNGVGENEARRLSG